MSTTTQLSKYLNNLFIYESKLKYLQTKLERNEMKQFNNNPSSSSYLVFIVLVPLFVVSVIVCLFSTETSSSISNVTSFSFLTKQTAPSSLLSINPCKENEVGSKLSKLERLEASLSRARAYIRKAAALNENQTSVHHHDDPDHYVPQGNIYRNARAFHRSYLEMEKMFKIYVYKEGEPPMFHDGPCKNIYTTEGMFIQQMEIETKYRTYDPDEAHVYFLPFSVAKMVQYLYVPDSHNAEAIKRTALDYVNMIALKYSYWNRSLGADHFMLSCHDWGPLVSFHVPNLYNNSIRVLCNANTSEGFDPSRDASLPEINLKTGDINGLVGGPPLSDRSILGFFAGHLHGYIRSILLTHWKGKDEDIRVYETVPKGVSYKDMMSKSKYCICPSGYEVASPRIVEAIYAECVPVLISDSYVPPFSDVLNWNSFSVQVPVKDIPNLKKILMEIPRDRYESMQKRVKEVQRHFVLNNGSPKRFDVFHMTLHSIWLRRLNIRIYD